MPDDVQAMFETWEIAAILKANESLLEAFMPEYIDQLDGEVSSINHLDVRRGVLMPVVEAIRRSCTTSAPIHSL